MMAFIVFDRKTCDRSPPPSEYKSSDRILFAHQRVFLESAIAGIIKSAIAPKRSAKIAKLG